MSFDALWRELDVLRGKRGMSYRRLAKAINSIDGQRRISQSTVHDRLANGRRVDWPEFRLVVLALGLAEEQWRGRWNGAEEQWHGRVADTPAATPATDRAAHLPADIQEFTGRDREVARLCRLHSGADRDRTAVAISAIAGMPGVGKTRLAVHVAHRLRHLHDEIQLYTDLHGYSLGHNPVEPRTALGVFLHLLGIAPQQIPTELDARAALYRARLDGRRALVVLDNAANAAQVLPLLPGSPTCHVLITSRRALAIDGVDTINLDVFRPQDAVGLLRRILGDARVDGEPEAAEEIAHLCGHLPLAVTLAAWRLRNRPEWRLADLAQRLRPDDSRVGELSVSDRGVRRVFDLSYGQQPAAARRLFRLLGVHPTGEFTAESAAALLGSSARHADRILERLLEEHLVQEVAPGRYRLHDLLFAYARERAEREESPQRRSDATGRVLSWYLCGAAAADRWLAPHRRHIEPAALPVHSAVPRFTDYTQALAWCEAERASLVQAAAAASAHGLDTVAWQLPQALYAFFCLRKHWDDWLASFRIALEATRRLADAAAEAWVLDGMGIALAEIGDIPAAIDCFQRALTFRRDLGDREGVADVLNNLGEVYRMSGRLAEAVAFYQEDLAICRESGYRYGVAISLNNIGKAEHALGRLTAAMDNHRQAIDVCREIGNRYTEGEALSDLADAYLARGDLADAQSHFQQALELRLAIGDRLGAARTQARLGDALHAAARPQARAHWRAAMAILAELDDPQAAELRGKLAAGR